jgi:uncharacterized membrane protein
LVILLTGISTGTQQAQAGLRFCNQSSVTFHTAIGYTEGKKGWIARGWLHIDPGQCKDALKFPLDNRFYYYYANGHDDTIHIKYKGEHPFCIEERKFLVPQANYGKSTDEDCAKDGLRSVGFKKLDVQGKPEYTVNLGGADNPPDAGGDPTAAPGQPPVASAPPPVQQTPAAAAPPPAYRQPPPAAMQQPPAAAEPPSASADPSMAPPRRRQRYNPEQESPYNGQPGSQYGEPPSASADPSMAPPRRRQRYNPEQDPPPPSNVQQPAPPAAQGGGGQNGSACQRFPNLC